LGTRERADILLFLVVEPMKNALVCGAGGFIEVHLVRQLKREGFLLIAATRNSTRLRRILDLLRGWDCNPQNRLIKQKPRWGAASRWGTVSL
jgi:NAD(P)-dependent dehydrogenase (short-subunit alcohol dehydrogenase family)